MLREISPCHQFLNLTEFRILLLLLTEANSFLSSRKALSSELKCSHLFKFTFNCFYLWKSFLLSRRKNTEIKFVY